MAIWTQVKGICSMKNKQNKVVSILFSTLFCVPYIILWYNICLATSVGLSEGVLSVFKDTFGEWIFWAGGILGILTFTSIIYLRFFVKKEWQVHLIAYFATILLIVMVLIGLNICSLKYKEFTPEKWIDFPAQRGTMYYDLYEKYDVAGYTTSEIENLLGSPDEISEDGTYFYDDTYGNGVYVKFENGRALYIYYVD